MNIEIAIATLYISSFLDNMIMLLTIKFLSNLNLLILFPKIFIKVSISSFIFSSFFPFIVSRQIFKSSLSKF